jgi:hypothetical protein
MPRSGAQADHAASSSQITAYVAGVALRVAAYDPAVAEHPWLAQATRFCLAPIADMDSSAHALELLAALSFLDAAYDTYPAASDLLDRSPAFLPADGALHVAGGIEEETVRPLDFAPYPNRPVRRLFDPVTISADLQRLADDQQDDGGWSVDFVNYSPAAALEWRGYMTVRAVSIPKRNSLA